MASPARSLPISSTRSPAAVSAPRKLPLSNEKKRLLTKVRQCVLDMWLRQTSWTDWVTTYSSAQSAHDVADPAQFLLDLRARHEWGAAESAEARAALYDILVEADRDVARAILEAFPPGAADAPQLLERLAEKGDRKLFEECEELCRLRRPAVWEAAEARRAEARRNEWQALQASAARWWRCDPAEPEAAAVATDATDATGVSSALRLSRFAAARRVAVAARRARAHAHMHASEA